MRGGPRSGGLKRWLVLHPVPRQEFAEAVLRDVGDAGEDVGKPGLGSISLSLAVVIRLNLKAALHARIDRADLVHSPVATTPAHRPEERRVGEERVSMGQYRWW